MQSWKRSLIIYFLFTIFLSVFMSPEMKRSFNDVIWCFRKGSNWFFDNLYWNCFKSRNNSILQKAMKTFEVIFWVNKLNDNIRSLQRWSVWTISVLYKPSLEKITNQIKCCLLVRNWRLRKWLIKFVNHLRFLREISRRNARPCKKNIADTKEWILKWVLRLMELFQLLKIVAYEYGVVITHTHTHTHTHLYIYEDH